MAEQSGGPACKYSYLEALSIEELEELLCASENVQRDDGYIDAVIAVIRKKESQTPSGRLPDVDEAWKEFQEQFNTAEGAGMTLYSEFGTEPGSASVPKAKQGKGLNRSAWRGLAVAAVLALCITTLLPPALGYQSFFAMVGQWNDTIFHFTLPGQEAEYPTIPDDAEYESLQAALTAHEITLPLVPNSFIEEFELIDLSVTEYEDYDRVDYNAVYENADTWFSIYLVQRNEVIKTRQYEKDESMVKTYRANDIDHYLFENNGRITIAWYNDCFECSVQGEISLEDAERLIDSIYER